MTTINAWYDTLVGTIGFWPTIIAIIVGVACVVLIIRTILSAAISRAQKYVLVSILSALGLPTFGPTVLWPLLLWLTSSIT